MAVRRAVWVRPFRDAGWVYVHTAEDYQKWAAENLKAEATPAETQTAAATPAAAERADTKTGGRAKK